MKIAVTGATGHVGRALLPRLLELGHEVRALCHGDTTCLDGLAVEKVQVDVRDIDTLRPALAGQEILLHMAALISVHPRDEPLMRAVNVDGTRNAATAALEEGVRRMVHVSSVHSFDIWRLPHPLTEGDPKAVRADLPSYDRSKASGEQVLHEVIAQGLDATILNPVGIIGPFDHRPSLIGQALHEMWGGRVPIVPRGGFCWVDVRDVADAIAVAMERGERGENYLLSTEHFSPYRFHQITQQAHGRQRIVLEVPMPLLRLVCPVAPLFRRVSKAADGFTADALHALDARLEVDASKAREHLNFRPRPIEGAVHDALFWWKENNYLA